MRSISKFIICPAGLFLLCSAVQAEVQTVTVPKGGTTIITIQNGPFNDCGNSGTVTNPNPSIVSVSPSTFSTSGSLSTFTFSGLNPGSDTITVHLTSDPSCIYSSTIFTYNATVVAPPQFPPTNGGLINAHPDGEPVSTATGELYGYDETADLATAGPLPLAFHRYYASYLVVNGVTSALGANWMSNFDVSLGVSGTTAKATLFRGKTVTFTQANGAWQLSSTEQRPFQLIASGSGYQLLDPRSNLIYTFNSAGALTAIQDRNGNTLTVTPGTNGPTQVSDGLGRTLTFTYTGSNLARVQDQAGRAVTFQYASGNLTSFTDANGKVTTFAYTSAGGINALMTSASLPNGNQPFTQTFDSQGRVATQSHALGAVMTFTYNAATNGLTSSEPNGPTLTYANDSSFNLISITDSNGVASKHTYDANYRMLSTTDRTGATTSATYDSASGLPVTYTDALGNKTAFRYAATNTRNFTSYDLASITFADGTSAAYARDASGNLIALTDQAGKTWRLNYNSAGEPVTATNPSGAVTKLAYGSDAMLSSILLPSGDTTSLAYDAAERPNLLTNPDSTTRSAQYDAIGTITSAVDERGDTTGASIDANDNLHSLTDAVNAVTTFSYDADNRPTSVTDALGLAIAAVYDANSRLQSVTDASGVGVSYVYDSLNRPTRILDSTGKGSTLAWDQEARLTAATDALSRTTGFTRDARGLVTFLTTPKGETFAAAWDVLGRPASGTDAAGRKTTFGYEPRGLLSALSLPGGVASSYSYNALGLLSGITDPRGNMWTTAYDQQGRLTSRTDPLGQATSVQYDSRQRVSAVSFPQIGGVQNSYDATGNLTGQTYSDGTGLSWTHDADNRVTGGTGFSVTYDLNGRITASNGLQITRDPAGRIASIVYASGKTVNYTYDNRGLLTQVADWIGGTTTFTYDAAHQLTSRTFPNGVVENFSYDKDGRPVTIQVSNGGTAISSIALTRDALGRVTAATRSAPNVPNVPTGYFGLEYDAASQSYASAYDPMGRVTQDSITGLSYTWDLASRLASYSGPNGSASFTYDAFGQRVSNTTGGVTQNYVLNYALPLPSVATVQTAGVDLRYYVWLPDGTLLESIEAADGTRHFYHFDESGTTNFLTGDSGAVTDSYAGTPYGETLVQTGSTPNPFTFHAAYGVMQEGATGLYYMRARYYDSTSARFLSRDSIAQTDPRALSPYQFVYANPMERADPAGLDGPYDTTRIKLIFGNVPSGPSLYTGQVTTLTLAPQAASSASIIPSFSSTATSIAACNSVTFSSCTTNLLFPFVTNANGFETGLALANTSRDPFAPQCAQSGTCTLNFYQSGIAGAANPSAVTAPNLTEGAGQPYLAGEDYAFTLTQALGVNASNPATFQGYIIAQTQFSYGHAFAYILGGLQPGMFVNPTNTAMGYLALVLNRGISPTSQPVQTGPLFDPGPPGPGFYGPTGILIDGPN